AEADALTPTEQRVAELLAAGLTYREVGEALFISPKTVQWNVSKIYRKLGVRSRAQLAARLDVAGEAEPAASDGDAPAAPPVPGEPRAVNPSRPADFAARHRDVASDHRVRGERHVHPAARPPRRRRLHPADAEGGAARSPRGHAGGRAEARARR